MLGGSAIALQLIFIEILRPQSPSLQSTLRVPCLLSFSDITVIFFSFHDDFCHLDVLGVSWLAFGQDNKSYPQHVKSKSTRRVDICLFQSELAVNLTNYMAHFQEDGIRICTP